MKLQVPLTTPSKARTVPGDRPRRRRETTGRAPATAASYRKPAPWAAARSSSSAAVPRDQRLARGHERLAARKPLEGPVAGGVAVPARVDENADARVAHDVPGVRGQGHRGQVDVTPLAGRADGHGGQGGPRGLLRPAGDDTAPDGAAPDQATLHIRHRKTSSVHRRLPTGGDGGRGSEKRKRPPAFPAGGLVYARSFRAKARRAPGGFASPWGPSTDDARSP